MDYIEQARDATTPNEMRAEILRLSRHNHIVRAAMDCADYNGLSSEDRYTMLAYHALSSLLRLEKAMHEYVVTMPATRLVGVPAGGITAR